MRDPDKITRYFLGELSTQEAQHFERQCFDDRPFAESVFVVEDELIDQYVRDELSRDERERFERFYLTTEARRLRVDVARALNLTMNPATKVADPRPFELHRLWQRVGFNRALSRYAVATLALAAVAIAVWLLIRNSNKEQIAEISPQTEVASPAITRTPFITPSPTVTASPTGTPARPRRAQVATVVFTLLPGAHRAADAGEQLITLPPQTEVVELRFVIPDQVQQPYEIRVETVESERVLLRRGLTAVAANGRQIVVLRAPASAFAARDYIAKVLGSNGDAAPSYTFRVTKSTRR